MRNLIVVVGAQLICIVSQFYRKLILSQETTILMNWFYKMLTGQKSAVVTFYIIVIGCVIASGAVLQI